MNALKELESFLEDKTLKCACISIKKDGIIKRNNNKKLAISKYNPNYFIIILKVNHSLSDEKEFKEKLDFEYEEDKSIINGIIWFKENQWLKRQTKFMLFDYWELIKEPDIPKICK